MINLSSMKQPLLPTLVLIKEMKVDHVATGKRVRAYREHCKVGQACVAAQLGQAYETVISDMERGKRIWTQDKLNRVLDAINACTSISQTKTKNKTEKEITA
jgi:predicted transcriptional regulator